MRKRAEIDRLNRELPRYCNADRDERGNIRIYFRRALGAPKLRLRAEWPSRAFWQEYEDAKAWGLDSQAWQRRLKGLPPLAAQPISTTILHTLGWLVLDYYKSDAFKVLKNKRPRELVLDNMLKERLDPEDPASPLVRDMPLRDIDDRDVRALMQRKVRWTTEPNPENPDDEDDQIEVRRGTEAANARVKALRSVIDHGFTVYRDIVTDRWAHKVDFFPASAEGFHCWTTEEVERFRSAFPVGTKERLAVELLYWTGQRRGDIVRLSRFHLDGAVWSIRQEKNFGTKRETTAWVPIFPELQSILDASQSAGVLGNPVYLVSERGSPFTKESFGNWFRDACDRAGLPQCSAHGLRKAFVVQMIFKRVKPQQIMAITGHRTQKEFDRYARDFLRKEAALQVYEELCKEHGFAA